MSDNPHAQKAQEAAADFRAALSGEAGQRASAEPRTVRPAPADGAVPESPDPREAPAEEPPAPRISGTLAEAAAGSVPAAAEPLDRPGKPLLAGAAIAGLLLVAAPFAVTTGVPALTLDASPLSFGADTAAGPGPGPVPEAQAQGAAADASAGGTATTTAPQPPPAETGGYVPEIREDGGPAPSLPDPGTDGGARGGAVETSPAERGGPTAETAAGDPQAPAGDAGGTPDAAGETVGRDLEPDGDTPPVEGEPEGVPASGEDAAPGEDTPGGTEQDPATGTDGGTDAQEQDAGGAEATGDTAPDPRTGTETQTGAEAQNGTEPQGAAPGPQDAAAPETLTSPPEDDGSVLENALAQAATEPEPYLAVAGPGCLTTPGASYTREGRWDSAEGTTSWATRPGGYAQEGCDGGYEAIPVSGDPERGDGQYAAWTFAPGGAGAVCDLYVHVPDDESPLWVASGEARYQIFPGSAAEGEAAAVFGFDQSEVRGGWVQVTGFTSPAEEFTVQLTNAGANALADQEHTSAHVAASAVRASCS
ncbi:MULTISPECIES: hypothetical protein [unclassified Nocardiopsis]|uniref:hypothetical protein n=1 Tax=unclassified Nocardiopsis TaxID=2649073 RepID=UPI00135801CD|nr:MULTISPECIES: hypothetical protein [unclassified Nocardiopsis]